MKEPLLASAVTYFSILCYRMPDNTYAEGLVRWLFHWIIFINRSCLFFLREVKRRSWIRRYHHQFCQPAGDVRIPTELVLPRMSDDEQCRLFAEKLELIETCQHFFIQRKVSVWINLTPAVAHTLLSDAEYASQIERFSFLELAINESYPELNKGKDNPTLAALAARFPLILQNYGAGGISTRAILMACSNVWCWIKLCSTKDCTYFIWTIYARYPGANITLLWVNHH